MPPIRLATCSPAAQATPQASLALLETLARRAAAQHIDLLLFPEAFLGSGYPRGEDFGCAVGSRTPAGREAFLDYFRRAVDFGDVVGPAGAGAPDWVHRSSEADAGGGDGTRQFLERVARETGVFLVVGAIERAGGSLYCAAVYVCPKLGILAKRRKVQPTGSERLIWAAAGPATLRAVSTTIRGVRINLAAAICWENYMPLVRQALYAQNVNLYLAPTADGRPAWLGLLQTIGTEGRCFVVSSNMCTASAPGPVPLPVSTASTTSTAIIVPPARINGRRKSSVVHDEDGNEIVIPLVAGGGGSVAEAAIEEEEEEEEKQAAAAPGATAAPGPTAESKLSRVTTRGGSAIVSPFGDVLAGPQWDDAEGIVWADVDFDDCIRGRLDIDVGGSYSRNDSFQFSVDGLDLSPLPY